MEIDPVVAHYEEDLHWLRRLPDGVRPVVYSKGQGTDGAFPLPNVGREAHTYLHHIATCYDKLPEVTGFSQGHPFDHVPDLLRILFSGPPRRHSPSAPRLL